MIIQIYAFTRTEQAVEAGRNGVDQIGFVVGKYNIVQGELSFEEARSLVAALPDHTRSSALTMATELEEILRMAETVEPDIIHISTDPYEVGLETMKQLKKQLPDDIQLMKAIPVGGDESIRIAEEFAPFCDFILLDTKGQRLPGVGATGKTHDWGISRRIVQSLNIPVILAGGLTPENVAEAIRVVQPAGVDSNTGTNKPGDLVEKDMERVQKFVETVRDLSLK